MLREATTRAATPRATSLPGTSLPGTSLPGTSLPGTARQAPRRRRAPRGTPRAARSQARRSAPLKLGIRARTPAMSTRCAGPLIPPFRSRAHESPRATRRIPQPPMSCRIWAHLARHEHAHPALRVDRTRSQAAADRRRTGVRGSGARHLRRRTLADLRHREYRANHGLALGRTGSESSRRDPAGRSGTLRARGRQRLRAGRRPHETRRRASRRATSSSRRRARTRPRGAAPRALAWPERHRTRPGAQRPGVIPGHGR